MIIPNTIQLNPLGRRAGRNFNQSASKDGSSKSSRIVKLILCLMYTQTPPQVISTLLFAHVLLFVDDPFLFVFWSSLYSFLTLLFAKYSPFYLCLFLLSLTALSLSFQPIFTQNPFSMNLNYNNVLRLTKL